MFGAFAAAVGERPREPEPRRMPTPQPPPLARALRAALAFRQPALDVAHLAPALFVETAARCDAADRAYRAAIERVLAPDDAREVLGTASAFRARVREIRSAARSESDALLAASRRAPVEFDPLDVVAPRIDGLNHVDVVRMADLCDRARQQVAALRAQANARIAAHLSDGTRDELVSAKRARIVAFTGAVHAELLPHSAAVERFSQTVESLAALADGWY